MMEKLVVAVLFGAVLIFLGCVLGTILGGFAGWIVGFFWTDAILDFLRRFGVDTQGMSTWQIGVALGFMGGFFKSSLTQRDSK